MDSSEFAGMAKEILVYFEQDTKGCRYDSEKLSFIQNIIRTAYNRGVEEAAKITDTVEPEMGKEWTEQELILAGWIGRKIMALKHHLERSDSPEVK